MDDPNAALLTIAWAAGAGLSAQLLGRRWRIPPIVFLLLLGVLLGPWGANVVRPVTLGVGLSVLVKLAVAVVLFEGALSLRLGDLRRALREVRRLVTIGVLVSGVGAMLAARLIAGLSWSVAMLFGTLMTVTGPTVVQPLLRRIPLPRRVRTTLEGEAILVDPVGAVLAVTVMDLVLGLRGFHPLGILAGSWGYFARLLVGLLAGAVGGLLLSQLLRARVAPQELVNLVVLAAVWIVFAAAEAILSDAGIMAAVTLGLALQRGAVPQERQLRRFKEQLTVLAISLVFVLLAATLPLDVLIAERWRGGLTVLALMLVVRPLSVALSLRGSMLSWRDRVYVAWIGPRGIIAASVASLFALTLADRGNGEGQRLLAITFLAIAVTVVVQGLTAGVVARLLGLQRNVRRSTVIVGAGPLGRTLATILSQHGQAVTMVDRNHSWAEEARRSGFHVSEGNALEDEVLAQAGTEEADMFVALTSNAEANALAAQLAQGSFGVPHVSHAVGLADASGDAELVQRGGGHMAFGRPVDVRRWDHDLGRGCSHVLTVMLPRGWRARSFRDLPDADAILPLLRLRQGRADIATADERLEPGDAIVLAATDGEPAVREWLQIPEPS